VSLIVGPILGGIIYGFWGIKMVFLINGLSFVLSAISEMYIEYHPNFLTNERINIKGAVSDIKDIVNFIMKRKMYKHIFIVSAIMNIFLNAGLAVIIPFLYRETIGFSAWEYGLIEAFFTVGILIGNVLLGVFFAKGKLLQKLRTGLIFTSISYIGISIVSFPFFLSYFEGITLTYFIIIGILQLSMGLFIAFVDTPLISALQQILPKDKMSRFFSFFGIASHMAVPIGGLVYGILLDHMPSYLLLLIVSSCGLIAISIGILTIPIELEEALEKNQT